MADLSIFQDFVFFMISQVSVILSLTSPSAWLRVPMLNIVLLL